MGRDDVNRQGADGAVAEKVSAELYQVLARGLAATVDLVGAEHLPEDYRASVRRGDRPCVTITVNFASRDRLIDAPGMLSFARTRTLCYVANFTDICPEMAGSTCRT